MVMFCVQGISVPFFLWTCGLPFFHRITQQKEVCFDPTLDGGFKYVKKLHPEDWGFMIQMGEHMFQMGGKKKHHLEVLEQL